MSLPRSFEPGRTVVLRYLWDGKIWSASPAIVVQDKPELVALYLPSGTIAGKHKTLVGKPVTIENLINSEWTISEEPDFPEYDRLMLTVPGSYFSIILFKNYKENRAYTWYINLEEPVVRTENGFDHIDLVLDAIVSPDFSEWRWDDEDELEVVVKAGLISASKAELLYVEGKKAVEMLQSGESIFNVWERWHPEPSWALPVLPAGWDII